MSSQIDKSTSNNNLTNNKEDENIGNFIIYITLIILLIFIIFFIYNLFKCYIPKWRKEKLSNDKVDTIKYSNVIEDITVSK